MAGKTPTETKSEPIGMDGLSHAQSAPDELNGLPSILARYMEHAGKTVETLELLNPGTKRAGLSFIDAAQTNYHRMLGHMARLNAAKVPDSLLAHNAAPNTREGFIASIRNTLRDTSLQDHLAGPDECGLTPTEAMLICMALPTSVGTQALTATSHPELFTDFRALCKHAGKSDDKYVARYRETHDGKFLVPRVVVVDDVTPAAASAFLLWSTEPYIVITTALLKSASHEQAMNVLRHELAHSYKQMRNHHLTKTILVKAVPFYNGAHAEERRADLFAPRSPSDLRHLAALLNTLGDVSQTGNDLFAQATNIMRDNGTIDDLLKDSRNAIPLPNNRVFRWGINKVINKVERRARREIDKVADNSGIFTLHEDGSITGKPLEDIRAKTSPSHPTIRERCEYLEEAAQSMDKGLGIPVSKPVEKSHFRDRARVFEAESSPIRSI